MNGNSRTVKQQRGFTTMQMIITIAIIAIISSVGVLGIRNARAEFRLQNSARVFASYVEKARADSIRRHAAPGNESYVETFGAGNSSYAVTMDFGDGAGVVTRMFQLEPGIDFETAALRVTFNWRGQLTQPCVGTKGCVFQVRSLIIPDPVPVDVSGSGDITVGNQHFPDQSIPDVAISEVTNDVATPTPPSEVPPVEESPSPEGSPAPEATPTPSPGNGNGNGGDNGGGNDGSGPGNGNGNPQASPSPTPDIDPGATPTPTPVSQCSSTISPSTLLLSQSDSTKKSGSAIFTMANGTGTRIISAAQAGGGNSLGVEVGLQRIDGSGSSVITISTKHGAGNRGTFVVEVSASPSCGSTQQLTVSVSN